MNRSSQHAAVGPGDVDNSLSEFISTETEEDEIQQKSENEVENPYQDNTDQESSKYEDSDEVETRAKNDNDISKYENYDIKRAAPILQRPLVSATESIRFKLNYLHQIFEGVEKL